MSQQIAIVMSEVFLRRLTPSLMPFVQEQQDFRILSIHRPIDELRRLLDALRPSGLITEWQPEVTEALVELRLPTVIAGTDLVYPNVVSIDVDDWEVGAEAAMAFSQAGFKSFACLGNGLPYSEQRIEGFRQAVDQAIPTYTETALRDTRYSEHFASPSPGLVDWIKALPKPVGIFAVHDPLGRFLCEISQQLGYVVPETVAVIGANNDPMVCGLTHPMLSSVSIPWDRIGGRVGREMQALLAGGPGKPVPIHLPPSGVVMRHSANHLAVENRILRRAMSYLSEHFQETISIGQMCDDLRLARRSLERQFKAFYKCTPKQMLSQLRVNRAKQLLSETNHSVALISELCGFNDPERMAVVFKRVAGVSPTSFRKASYM